ncbi:AfsR/SARP family transcriptional regulator [Catellatospora methionotrophica]|uniref:AfsR/SARP family transcriptional regulator n=1 Tax=Catellatospora methionotrophica TaxID=121620 RepID=UPI0033D12F64
MVANSDRWVGVSRLVDCLWPDDPPATADRQVRNCAASLRRTLVEAGLAPADLAVGSGGYLLRTGGCEVDRQRFESLVAAARRDRDAGDLPAAAAGLRAADRLWRGPALAGLAEGALAAEALRLEEWRLQAVEDRVAVELDLGLHRVLVPELLSLADAHPGRDRLQCALMVALCRAGSAAGALHAFDRVRSRLSVELGVPPGSALQRARRAILAGVPFGLDDLLPSALAAYAR